MFPAAQARDKINHVVSGQRPALHPRQHRLSTHASNEPYQTAMSDGFGFPASSNRASRFCKVRMFNIVVNRSPKRWGKSTIGTGSGASGSRVITGAGTDTAPCPIFCL